MLGVLLGYRGSLSEMFSRNLGVHPTTTDIKLVPPISSFATTALGQYVNNSQIITTMLMAFYTGKPPATTIMSVTIIRLTRSWCTVELSDY